MIIASKPHIPFLWRIFQRLGSSSSCCGFDSFISQPPHFFMEHHVDTFISFIKVHMTNQVCHFLSIPGYGSPWAQTRTAHHGLHVRARTRFTTAQQVSQGWRECQFVGTAAATLYAAIDLIDSAYAIDGSFTRATIHQEKSRQKWPFAIDNEQQ